MKEAIAPKTRLGYMAQPGSCAQRTTSEKRAARRKSTRMQPLVWPPDPQHTYALWLEPAERPGAASRAYVTAHPVYRDIGVHSRFAVRLELAGTYHSRSTAAADGFAIARRFYQGRYSPIVMERVKTLNGYSIVGHARFRIDCHQWEPTLTIRSERPRNKGVVQTFDGGSSPFVQHTFPTARRAADYALVYGERLVLGLVAGLRI
jgi:hypothetical protein